MRILVGIEIEVIGGAGVRGGLWFCYGQILGWELDSGGIVGIDLRQRAKEQAVDVSQNSGAARGDAVLSQELIEAVEGMVDALGGLEVMVIPCEGGIVGSRPHLLVLTPAFGPKAA